MMNLRKKRLALAVAGAVSLVTYTVHAEDFTASATLQNTLTVTNVLDLDIGTVFASATGANYTNGVGAVVIRPDGVVEDAAAESATVTLTSLSTPVGAQGSIAMAADFSLTLPDTSTIAAADFDDGNTGAIAAILTAGTELVHESSNPDVPSLWLMHFTVEAVSGGTVSEGTPNVGDFSVVQDFGETDFVFNIGATVTTEPNDSGTALDYQAGVYSGIFEVTAAY